MNYARFLDLMLQQFIDPEKLLREGGFYVVMFVIFAETGLFLWILSARRLPAVPGACL